IGGFVFPGATVDQPLSYSSVRKAITALRAELGIEAPPRPIHAFRHSYACALADEGTPIAMICELCGWSDLGAATPYLRATNVDRHALIERVHGRSHRGQTGRAGVQKKHSHNR